MPSCRMRREHDVKDDQVGLGLLDHLDGFGARCGGGHIESGEMQGCDEQFTDGRFVVDNNNGCFNRLAHGYQLDSMF